MKKHYKLIFILGLVFLFIGITIILLYTSYLKAVSKDSTLKTITIESGMSTTKIGNELEKNNLVKSGKFFVFYLKLNKINDLKAGQYELSESMNLKEIVNHLQKGNNYNNNEISITFKEGITMREIAKVIANNTNNSYDSVMELVGNREYLNSLIDDYWFVTDSIFDSNIYYSLEGYLFPDTYNFRSKDVSVSEIFKKLLDQMNLVLTQHKGEIDNSSFSIHQLLTLASIAEKEVTKESDRANVISVFINRLDIKMALGSDVTTRYGLKLDETRALTSSEYASSNSYNTRNSNMAGKLPAGPISTISKSSIEASLNPNDTKYLYFISNIETNETFFFETSKAFEAKKVELKDINKGY